MEEGLGMMSVGAVEAGEDVGCGTTAAVSAGGCDFGEELQRGVDILLSSLLLGGL